jgi:hypothetical protein
MCALGLDDGLDCLSYLVCLFCSVFGYYDAVRLRFVLIGDWMAAQVRFDAFQLFANRLS